MRRISRLPFIVVLMIASLGGAYAADGSSSVNPLTVEERVEAAEARAEAAEARARKAERELRALKSKRRAAKSVRRATEADRQAEKEASRQLDELINRQYLRDAESKKR